MACPDFSTLTLPILETAAAGQDLGLAALRAAAAERLGLTEADLAERIPSGRQTRFHNRSNWACIYMTEAGLLEWVRRGTYRITSRGREVVAQGPGRIDVEFLSTFAEFRAWRSGSSAETSPDAPAPTPVDAAVATITPEEQIERDFAALRQAVRGELITKILSASPAFFQSLVVKLLVAMNYGGSLADAGRAMGRSGDGDIDGIIKEDVLGFDAIYVQARRWDPASHKVSRPDVQAFVGSLELHRARKGVFLTTTTFSAEAHDYVSRIEKKIVLIDGPRMTELMFDYGVGVREKETYVVKEVDEDYFIEE